MWYALGVHILTGTCLCVCHRAKGILKAHEQELHSLAAALLEKETLSGEQIADMIKKARSVKAAQAS